MLQEKALTNLAGHDVAFLLQREKWLEFSSAGFNVHLILTDTLNHFFKKRWCRSVIYVFENQPWEKMLCAAARKNNVKTIGYQHSCIAKFFLSQFIGKEESLFTPLPDKLITSGEYSVQLYKEGRMPEDKIVIGGAWRYPHVTNGIKHIPPVKKDATSKVVVLVALTLDISVASSMLEHVLKIISKNCLGKKVEFWIKPHPGNTQYELDKLSRFLSKCHIVNEPFNILLKDVDIVISTTSASGLEAFLYGKKAVSYIPENIITADPLLDINDERVYKWYEGEDIDINFLKNFLSVPDPDILNTIRKQYFSKINREVWLKYATLQN